MLAAARDPDAAAGNGKDASPKIKSKQRSDAARWVGDQTSSRASTRDSLTEFLLGLGRGFALGFGAKGGLAGIFTLIKHPKNPSKVLLSVANADTIRFGLFCGMFAGTYRGIYCWLTKLRGTANRQGAFIAGGLAGLSILIDAPTRRLSVSLFLLVRALDAAVKRLVRAGLLPHSKHAVPLLFGIFNMPIMYSFLYKPHLIGEGYYRWILGMGAMNHEGLHHCLREPRNAWYERGELIPFRQCQEGYHPGETCVGHTTTDWAKGLARAAKIYIPVHLVPLLLFKTKRLVQDPGKELLRAGTAVAMSSAFLSTYVFCVKFSQCVLRNAFQFDYGWGALLSGLSTGLSTYLERPSRASELMLFCAPKGITAAWKYFADEMGVLKPVPNGEVAIFCLAAALFMSAAKEDVKSSYMSVMRLLVGLS